MSEEEVGAGECKKEGSFLKCDAGSRMDLPTKSLELDEKPLCVPPVLPLRNPVPTEKIITWLITNNIKYPKHRCVDPSAQSIACCELRIAPREFTYKRKNVY